MPPPAANAPPGVRAANAGRRCAGMFEGAGAARIEGIGPASEGFGIPQRRLRFFHDGDLCKRNDCALNYVFQSSIWPNAQQVLLPRIRLHFHFLRNQALQHFPNVRF
jgi:hypothetical protein